MLQLKALISAVFFRVFPQASDILNAFFPRAKLRLCRWILLVLAGIAICIFTAGDRIGGPFVEITITVITNFKACL